MLDIVFVCLKICLFTWPEVPATSVCFLSHRHWLWLDIVLHWRQKFRFAASWENDDIGSPGNIVKQVNKLPDVGCVCNMLLLLFIFRLTINTV
jgi:hypothetical protein